MRRQAISLVTIALLALPAAGSATGSGKLVVHDPIPVRASIGVTAE